MIVLRTQDRAFVAHVRQALRRAGLASSAAIEPADFEFRVHVYQYDGQAAQEIIAGMLAAQPWRALSHNARRAFAARNRGFFSMAARAARRSRQSVSGCWYGTSCSAAIEARLTDLYRELNGGAPAAVAAR